MRHFVFPALIAALCAVPATAQDTQPPVPPSQEEGFSLMEEGARLFLRGLMREVEPAMDDLKSLTDQLQPNLEKLLTELGPTLNSLADLMDDALAYETPERLPNGDIIIRRKADAPPVAPDAEEIDI